MSRAGTAIFAAMLATLIAGTGHGHEGHDHAPQPAVSANGSPRGEAASELFELVAIAKGEELVVYLDRFATNEPVTEATVEVETPAGPATAAAAGGVFRLKAPWLAKPGHY